MICESVNYKERGYHGVKISDTLRFKRGSLFVMSQYFKAESEKGRKCGGHTLGYQIYIRNRIR